MSRRQVWFISDTHFGHAAIIRLCGRPFADAAEMDAAMIDFWNERVGPADLVYHLGDFAMTPKDAERVRPQLNGTIRLLVGNHDSPIHLSGAGLFQKMYLFRVFPEDGFVASHIPMARHLCPAPFNLHGHIHNIAADIALAEPHQVNLSVEMWDYRPVHRDEVLAHLATLRGDG